MGHPQSGVARERRKDGPPAQTLNLEWRSFPYRDRTYPHLVTRETWGIVKLRYRGGRIPRMARPDNLSPSRHPAHPSEI